MSVLSNGELNLSIVDQSFGKTSDLYKDVLKVRPNCSPQKIQESYFKRRDEIIHKLNKIEQTGSPEKLRRTTERRMDAVVCAVRILGDDDLRSQYDAVRDARLHPKKYHKKKKQQQQKSVDTTSTALNMTYTTEEENSPPRRSLRKVSLDKSSSSAAYSVDGESEIQTMVSYDDDEDYTVYTLDSRAERYLQKPKPKGFIEKVRFELMGALDDTSRSFEQVFNVFTLQEEEIKAVMGRIDKAKRQMSLPVTSPNDHHSSSSSSPSHQKSKQRR